MVSGFSATLPYDAMFFKSLHELPSDIFRAVHIYNHLLCEKISEIRGYHSFTKG